MDKFEAEGDASATLRKKRWLLDFANKEFGNKRSARCHDELLISF
jgi:hypothetical protein